MCSNCKKRYVNADDCQYAPRVRTRTNLGKRKIASPPPKIRAPSVERSLSCQPLGLSDAQERVLELRLFYEYTRSTCITRSPRAMIPLLCSPVWECDVPQIAFSSDIVLNALLALTALHLHNINPDDQILGRASLTYLDRAVTKHQAALSRVDYGSAEPLLVAAVLIAHHTWLTAHSKDPGERYAIDLRTYHMWNGIKALVQQSQPWLNKYEWPTPDYKSYQDENMVKKGFMDSAMQDVRLLSAEFNRQGVPLERQVLYNAAVKELIVLYLMIAVDSDIPSIEQAIVTYLHRVPEKFVSLLEIEDPIAMSLLARDLSMLSLFDDSPAWWLHGSGEHKVAIKSVLGIRGLLPPDLVWLMNWPVKVISKEIDLYSNGTEAGT